MKRVCRGVLTALFLAATLALSAGCSRDGPVLRGSEEVYRVKRSFQKPTLLYVMLGPGQEGKHVHAEGWYLSEAYMSRIFEMLGDAGTE